MRVDTDNGPEGEAFVSIMDEEPQNIENKAQIEEIVDFQSSENSSEQTERLD